MIVSVIITSHCQISCWLVWVIIWVWREFHHLIAKNSRDIQSNIIEIQIQIQTNFAIFAEEIAVSIASIINITPRAAIPHHNGIVSLFCTPKNMSIPHLISAHKANIQTISLPTKLASLHHISTNPSMIAKIPMINRKEI